MFPKQMPLPFKPLNMERVVIEYHWTESGWDWACPDCRKGGSASGMSFPEMKCKDCGNKFRVIHGDVDNKSHPMTRWYFGFVRVPEIKTIDRSNDWAVWSN